MGIGTAAAIGAGASLVGDWMAQQGANATNQAQMSIAEANNREMTYLASNAMQLRVEDLKRAGLNPMLAVGTQGAVVPNLQQPSLQNPNAAYGNLGSQVSSAVQLQAQQSQIEANKASAARDNAAASKTAADEANVRAGLPYTGATAQASLDNLRRTNDNLQFQALALERDYTLSQKSLPQLMQDPTFAGRMAELKALQTQVDLQRSQLGIPKLENDSMWQRAHPELSGWMQSGVPDAAINAAGVLSRFIPRF